MDNYTHFMVPIVSHFCHLHIHTQGQDIRYYTFICNPYHNPFCRFLLHLNITQRNKEHQSICLVTIVSTMHLVFTYNNMKSFMHILPLPQPKTRIYQSIYFQGSTEYLLSVITQIRKIRTPLHVCEYLNFSNQR